jgi:hypothetical protein
MSVRPYCLTLTSAEVTTNLFDDTHITGCKANIPDASGSFPIHLACSRIENKFDDAEEDLRR